MKLAKALSKRIKTLREASGLSQQEVATRGDLSLSLVAKLEQGKKADPRASTLLALSHALGVRAGELLDDLFPKGKRKAKASSEELPVDLEKVVRNGHGAEEEKNGKAKKTKPAKKKKKKARA